MILITNLTIKNCILNWQYSKSNIYFFLQNERKFHIKNIKLARGSCVGCDFQEWKCRST